MWGHLVVFLSKTLALSTLPLRHTSQNSSLKVQLTSGQQLLLSHTAAHSSPMWSYLGEHLEWQKGGIAFLVDHEDCSQHSNMPQHNGWKLLLWGVEGPQWRTFLCFNQALTAQDTWQPLPKFPSSAYILWFKNHRITWKDLSICLPEFTMRPSFYELLCCF